jgi:hypothetical protein
MGLQHATRAWEVCCRAVYGYMPTVGSSSGGRFDQNPPVKRISPPPQPNSQLLQVQQRFAVFAVFGRCVPRQGRGLPGVGSRQGNMPGAFG